jgi:hypothetical protein
VFISARVVTVASLACLLGGVWVIATGGSVLFGVLMLLGARALAEPGDRGWIAASAPVWAGAVVVAVWRAGSADLGDIAGAHHVLGAGLLRGPTLTVASLWLVALGCIAIAGAPHAPVARLAWAAQAVLVIALVAAPQVTGFGDAVVWVGALVVLAAQIAVQLVAGPAQRLLIARVAVGLAVVAGALA